MVWEAMGKEDMDKEDMDREATEVVAIMILIRGVMENMEEEIIDTEIKVMKMLLIVVLALELPVAPVVYFPCVCVDSLNLFLIFLFGILL